MTGDRSPIDVILVVGRLGAPVPVTVRRSSTGTHLARDRVSLAGVAHRLGRGDVIKVEAEATAVVSAEVEGSRKVSAGVLTRVDRGKSMLGFGCGMACGLDEHPTTTAAAIPANETLSGRRILLLETAREPWCDKRQRIAPQTDQAPGIKRGTRWAWRPTSPTP